MMEERRQLESETRWKLLVFQCKMGRIYHKDIKINLTFWYHPVGMAH
jgi:hypothetical protein